MTDQEKDEIKEAIENIKDPMDKFNARRMWKLYQKKGVSDYARNLAIKDVKKFISSNK